MGRHGAGGLFDRGAPSYGHNHAAVKKRQKKMEEKRILRERKSRILRDSIIDRKAGERDIKFASSGDLRFQTPSVNVVN